MMVIEMIARDDIAAADFVRGEKDSGFTLKESPLRRVIEAYEERLEAKVRYGLRNENLRLRQCIEEQVRQLARVVKGEAQSYLPIAAM
jgi:CRISPR/Cas system-associated endonuclease Cas1